MKKKNVKRITEDQVKNAVKAKYQRMKDHLVGNPNNTVVSRRLAEFKKLHESKLIGV